ncbi:metal homeostatis BSD2 family protein [Aspergillus candidus]|uniref:Metal homeostatis protein Bsd2 n=1 Tax=Aspergillus candidus TaxID=41067 RepID=A0A2I2EXZ0_ASPCN|nr:metal homeostatis protein Bsd2 [Aspergillus candidus]PLB33231.1 metal homeostatis protein Bsd2 [Aspergillus candidus]
MSSQRYQRVNPHEVDEDPNSQSSIPLRPDQTPSSPPPSFRSRSSSFSSRRLLHDDPNRSNADQTLADAFDDSSDSDSDHEPDDRQRLMRAQPDSRPVADTLSTNIPVASSSGGNSEQQQSQSGGSQSSGILRRPTMLPFLGSTGSSANRVVTSSNDGVFANLAAKPERGEKSEDLPPSYEEAAADATPPYWETTILAPGFSSDEVFVDGLPVGSVFSFVWNAMISMSFQLVGFLLTYLLHTTHAAKNGSRAGLGLTLVQYGFYMKGGSDPQGEDGDADYVTPPDPNSHTFDPDSVNGRGDGGAGGGAPSGISTSEWISYVLMIVGWFILIRAISDFLRARRHEQLVLQSPERGLNVPIIAEGERSETVV